MLAKPVVIYLDTNHLVNISRLKDPRSTATHFGPAYASLYEIVRSGAAAILFDRFAPIEWVDGNATPESARRVAEIVDSMPFQYEYESDMTVFAGEILRAWGRKNPHINLPNIPTIEFRQLGCEIPFGIGRLATISPEFGDLSPAQEAPDLTSRVITAAEYVEQALRFKQRRPHLYKERIDGFAAALLSDLALHEPGRLFTQADKVGWAVRVLRLDKLLYSLKPDADPHRELMNVDFTECPAVSLWFNARYKLLRKGVLPQRTDVGDWQSIAAVPYVDLFLTEKRLRSLIIEADASLQVRVHSSPDSALARLRLLTRSIAAD